MLEAFVAVDRRSAERGRGNRGMENIVRRRFVFGGLAGAGVVAAIGGGSPWAVHSRRATVYDDAVRETSRHGSSFDPPFAVARRELVRYATLAANGHNSQPWRFRVSERSISVAPDFGRHLAAVDPTITTRS